MVKRLSGIVDFKVGLEFFVAHGPDGFKKLCDIADDKAEIFLDLKLHDIPNTVAGAVRAAVGKDMTLVIPGIRPADSAKGDQKRTMTPDEAVKAGADYLVIGRPITETADPIEAARRILAQVQTK